MAQTQPQFIRQQISQLRKQLSKLEAERTGTKTSEPSIIWETFLKLNEELNQFEQMLAKINQSLEDDIHQCRHEIIANLEEYNRISQSMREMEKFFLINYLRPGYILKQAKRKREYLEKEYTRIRSGIIDHCFKSIHDVEAEIRNVMVHSDQAYQADQRSYQDEQVNEVNLWEMIENLTPEDLVEEYDENQIRDDFKRIVLPATHPDTSDTPSEVFVTVMAVYKALDYLMMEAYVAKYREDVALEPEQDILILYDQLSKQQAEYHRLAGRMERRLKAIKKELDPIEIDQPEKVKENILKLRENLRHAIQLETEKIFELRNKIQSLTDFFIQMKRTGDDQ